MNRTPKFGEHQRGAVAIMVGLTLVILVGMLALVVDLGHVYLVKTGLQNGADASALAGAVELDGTAAGVTRAKSRAIAMARQNRYVFDSPVGTADADGGLDLSVGSCPDDGCMMPIDSVTTDALAADKSFLRVHTRQRSMAAWFAGVFGDDARTLQTFGLAVAGKYAVDISPIGICQLPTDPTNPNTTELGYERGVTYRVSDANPLAPGTMFWIDPVATNASSCSGDVPSSLPYMCAGRIAFTPNIGDMVYTNTGISDPQLEALDSKFDVYNTKNKCDPASAPPDRNIKEYHCSNAKGIDGCVKNATTPGLPKDWMSPAPTQPSITFVEIGGVNQPKPWSSRTFADYGVLWSASRPQVAVNDNTDPAMSARWSSMYHAPANAVTNYPQPSPYAQTSGNFFRAPVRPGHPDRRMINMAMVDCSSAGGICRPLRVVAVGRFFMQRKASGNDKDIYVEFGGLLDSSFQDAEVRLFR
jgi:hypothetical protein